MTYLVKISQSRYRSILIIPAITQMLTLLHMAFWGRPAATHSLGPDWLLHTLTYCILAILSWIALHGINPQPDLGSHRFIGAVTAIVFGIIDESIQFTVPVRTFDPMDIVADAAGAVLGILLVSVYLAVAMKHSSKSSSP